MADPVGFSSPMGGSGGGRGAGARAWTTLVTEMNKAVTASKTIKDNMEAAAKAANAIAKGNGGLLGQGTSATGSAGNGGGARMPAMPGRSPHWINQSMPGSPFPLIGARPANFTGGMGAQLVNGGGASMPPAPTPNGGGPRFGGFGKVAGTMGAGMAAGVIADLMKHSNYESSDFLANRAARISGTPYNKDAAAHRNLAQFGGTFTTNEQYASNVMAMQGSGFTSTSAGYNRIASSARSMSALNPLLDGQGAATQLGFMAPEVINRSRMAFGFSTVGRGGAPKTVAEISQQLMGSVAGGRLLNPTQLAGELGPTGMLRQNMVRNGFDANMQQAVQDYLTESSGAGRYLSDSEIQKRRGPGSNTLKGAAQERASAEQGVITAGLREYANSFEAVNDKVIGGLEKLADTLNRFDAAAYALFGPAGAANAVTKAGKSGTGTAALTAAGVGAGWFGRKALSRHAGSVGRGASSVARGAGGAASTAGRFLGGVGGAVAAWDVADLFADSYLRDDMVQNPRKKGWGALRFWEDDLVKRGESGDGYGGRRSRQVTVSGSGWGGISRPEMGDGEGEGRGRGGSTLAFLENLIKTSGLPHRITSRVRGNARTTSGNLSYHATGHALDIAGPTPGVDTEDMLKINKFLAQRLGAGAQELIYSGPGGVNLHGGKPHSYSNAVRNLHHNHVHVAVTEESLKRIGKRVEGGTGAGAGLTAGAANARAGRGAEKARHGDVGGRGRRFRLGGGRFSEKRLISDLLGGMHASARGMDGVDLSETQGGDPSSATGVGSAGASVGAHAIDKFLAGLRDKESGGDYQAENGGTRGARGGGDTSASGAYQYVDGTWGNYKGYKYAAAAPPEVQDARARADAHRLYSRYGNWRNVAAAHFQGEGFAAKNSDPSTWKPHVQGYVKDVLSRAGLPESGDGYGMPSAGWTPMGTPEIGDGIGGGSGSGSRTTVNARSGGSIHIAKVEVHLTAPQVSKAEAERIGKMVVEQIARQARMQKVSD